jgi:hypothetical protein
LFIIFSAFQLKAQIDEQINSKSKSYIENRSRLTKIRSIPINYGILPITENQLIVIDNKIYKGTNAALKQIVKNSLDLLYTTIEETSNSGNRQTLVYRTKKPPITTLNVSRPLGCRACSQKEAGYIKQCRHLSYTRDSYFEAK